MDNKRVGEFIKELRKERGLSQYELADKLMVPRVSISKWERGIMGITSNNLIILSEFFGVTTDELMAGERAKKGLSDKVNEVTLKMLDNNKKLHGIIKYAIGIIFVLGISFLVYYFYTFYNSVKIYTIHLLSNKYVAKFGQLIKTRDKIYFYLDIDYLVEDIDSIESVQLFYLKDKKLVTLGERSTDQPFNFAASNGYDEYIIFNEFEDALNRMYIYVNFANGDYERVQLTFDRNYTNSKVIPKVDKESINNTTTKYKNKESTKVYERFVQVKEIIDKYGKDNIIDFKFEGKKYHLEVTDNELTANTLDEKGKYEIRYSYYNKEIFILTKFDENDFEEQVYSFDIQMGKCLEGDCTNHMDNYRELIRLINEIIYEYK